MGDTWKFVSALREYMLCLLLRYSLIFVALFPYNETVSLWTEDSLWSGVGGCLWSWPQPSVHAFPPPLCQPWNGSEPSSNPGSSTWELWAPGKFLNSATPPLLTCEVETMPSTSLIFMRIKWDDVSKSIYLKDPLHHLVHSGMGSMHRVKIKHFDLSVENTDFIPSKCRTFWDACGKAEVTIHCLGWITVW